MGTGRLVVIFLIGAGLAGCGGDMALIGISGLMGSGAGAGAATWFLRPIAGLAVEDAKTALAWIEREENAGRLGPDRALQARACPAAVIALADAQKASEQDGSTVEGKKGLIYFSTVKAYGPDHEAIMQARLAAILSACQGLIPHGGSLLRLFQMF